MSDRVQSLGFHIPEPAVARRILAERFGRSISQPI
jgi:hypothetical protein